MTRSLAVALMVLLVLVAILLTVVVIQLSAGAAGGFFDHQLMMRIMMRDYSKPSYRSEGERIYLTGRDAGGRPIPNSMGGGMMRMMSMGCANCHSVSGKGGLSFPDGRTKSADIRWRHLRKEYNYHTLRKAVTQGIDHRGRAMSRFMPRWQMTDDQLQALIGHLKKL